MKRFLIDKIVNSKVTLEGVEHNHLRNVLRMQVGDEVILNCGDGFPGVYTNQNIRNYSV